MITGIHHVNMKYRDGQYTEVLHFYRDILHLPLARSWDGGMMFAAGNSKIELTRTEDGDLPQGVIRHFALAADHIDEMIEEIRSAGYPITKEPKDICIPSVPPLPARIAFCTGPLGEEIELFDEQG